MSEPFIGEVRMVGFNFAPAGWATCDGQTIPITQNQALYVLIGTAYGGDGVSNFRLPDMRGRTPLHPGNSGQPCIRGQAGGLEAVTLAPDQIPSHGHSFQLSSQPADGKVATGKMLGNGATIYAPADSATAVEFAEVTITNSDAQGVPHNNMQPTQVVNFVIALQGLFPSRN